MFVKKQGSLLNDPIPEESTMQIYGQFEGYLLNSALFGLVIHGNTMAPVQKHSHSVFVEHVTMLTSEVFC